MLVLEGKVHGAWGRSYGQAVPAKAAETNMDTDWERELVGCRPNMFLFGSCSARLDRDACQSTRVTTDG
jgi:hypothetical protein